MIRFRINAIGKLKNSPVSDLIDDYKGRIRNEVEIKEFEFRRNQSLSVEMIKIEEAKLLSSEILKNSYLISIDEKGELLSSHELSDLVKQKANEGYSSFVFFIGGADGLHDSIRKQSDKIISLGRITLPHMLARLILVEQIYRIEKIMDNHPYDK